MRSQRWYRRSGFFFLFHQNLYDVWGSLEQNPNGHDDLVSVYRRFLAIPFPDDCKNKASTTGSYENRERETHTRCAQRKNLFFLHVCGISGTLSTLLSSLCSPSMSNGKSGAHQTSVNTKSLRALYPTWRSRTFYSRRTLKRNLFECHFLRRQNAFHFNSTSLTFSFTKFCFYFTCYLDVNWRFTLQSMTYKWIIINRIFNFFFFFDSI